MCVCMSVSVFYRETSTLARRRPELDCRPQKAPALGVLCICEFFFVPDTYFDNFNDLMYENCWNHAFAFTRKSP